MKKRFTILITAAFMLLTMMASTGTMWGQVVSGTTYNTTSSTNFPTGWTYDGEFATGNNPYLKLVASTNYIQTSNFAQNGFTSIKLKARKFGGPSAAEALITVSWYNNNTETVLGTIAPTSTTLTDYTISSPTNPTGNTTGYIKIQCKGASGSKGSGVSAVTITYTAGGDPTETHILTFVAAPAAGGTVSVNNNTTGTITLEEGENYNIIATPTEVGYAFNNWTVSGTGSSVGNASNASTTFTMGTEDATLTANFSTVTTYTVTYHANVTGIDNIETEYNAGSNVIVAENTFSNPGHAFTKWHTNAGGTGGTDYNPGDEIENISANINLYAQWEESSEATATLNIQSYGTAQGWDNGTQHTSITIDQVSFTASNGNNTGKYYNNVIPHEWRFYQSESATITISVPDGYHLVSITPTFSTNNGGVLLNGSTSVASGSTVSVSSTSVTFSVGNSGTATNGQVKFTNIIVNYEYEGGMTTPSYTITDNNELAYNATSGSFDFTVNNPVDGGATTVSEEVDWISNAAISGNSVTFNTTANEGTQREGIITLTYTYNTTETVTKEVTITQAAAPVVYSTIPALFAAATTTETNVLVTFNNWVVSGVSTNGKSIFVTDNNGNGFVIYYTSDMSNTFAAGNVLSGTAVSCTLKLYNGFAELLNVNVADLTITDGGTVTETSIDMATLAGVNTGALLHYDNLTCSVTSDKYYLSDGTTTLQVFNSLYAFEALENGKIYNITGIYQQYNTTKEILPRSADDIEEVVPTEPTITVQPATVSTPFTGAEGTLTVTYENITTIVAEVKFYEADGVTEATFDWIVADINSSNNVDYIIDANTGEARSAYLKVYALGNDSQDVYSNLVTINQAEYVAPTYAELPFEFNGGRADIENTDGLTQEGLGTDYNASSNPTTKLKFDGTGDWLLLQFNERPGTLTFDIKGNSFSGGTFKVQTSENGETYTDLKTYTTLGDIQNESFDAIGENVRYIKWIYTTKDAGNVGLGNIALAEYVAPVASITVTPDLIEAPATPVAPATVITGSLTVTLSNITITELDQLGVDFCDENGTLLTGANAKPSWFESEFELVNEEYKLNYTIAANTETTERVAYFKVYEINSEVYSNKVTVTQEAYVAPTATITVNPDLIEATAAETEGTLTVTLENMTITDVDGQLSIDFFHSDGSDFEPGEEKPDWVHAEFTLVNNVYSLNYTIDANTETAERNAYFKVYGLDDDGTTEAYSNLVTVTQAGYVVDYAELPFEWEGGTRSAFEALNGTSTSGVGDYGDNQGVYRMKLDGTGDYIQVKTNEQPGVVTIGVKMIGGATSSTITVQGSADGDTFTDVEELTISGSQNDELTIETTNDFAATDRYVRLYFTKGSNVGVGPITIAQVDNTPSITLSSYEIEATAEETDGEITVTYKNIETDLGVEILWFETATSTDPISAAPEWIDADINSDMNVEYLIEANTGEARSAYFKVFAMGSSDFVYSNLVTINQAASAPQVATYELVESIDDLVPGVHYYIAGKNGNDWYAMGEQKSNNRAAVAVTVTNDVITETEDVYEFVISGDATNLYTIYDESAKSMGYLFAPAGTSSNYLRTQSTNTNNGEWTISINETTHVATIKANITNNKYMRYNYGSTVFSCYSSNTSQKDIYLYKKVGDSNPVYYSPTATTIENPDPTTDPIIVLNNEILTITGSVTCTPDDILIQDGGQLIHDTPINATIQRNVKGYDANRDASPSGYMLIASPVYAPINVTSTNLTTGEYDLYIFAESQPEKEWRNYKAGEFTTIENEKGYLYANKSNGTISFAGTLRSSINNVTVNLDYTDGNRFSGWNLVGNPFACNVYANDTTGKGLAFYKMNENGDGFEAVTNGSVAPMEGIFVHTDSKGKSFVFTRSIPEQSQGKGNLNIQIAQVVNNRDVQRVSDNAIIRFDGGNNLEKFSFSDNNDKLYFTLGNKDYSVFSAEARGEMPISFKTQTNGTYTISFDMDNVEFSYLHLIDNKTGIDIDLLDNQTYTFEASKVDYASRFRLVFSAIGDSDSNSDVDNDFGFFDANGNLNILGIEGLVTLQVIDVTGRVISNETFSGNYSKAINAKAGVYMLRLIQGNDVRTQKIVVK